MLKYRVGRITTGIAFVALGLLIFISQISKVEWSQNILKLWPLVIIGYGIEYLLAARKRERTKFDVGGAIIVALIMIMMNAYVFVNGHGLNVNLSDLSYKVEDSEIVISDPIASVTIDGYIGKITIQPAKDDDVTIRPTYRAQKKMDIEKIRKEIQLNARTNGDRLIVEVKNRDKRNWLNNLMKMNPVGIDLLILAPKDILIDSSLKVGSIEINEMENLRSITNEVGDIVVLKGKGEDVQIQLSTGEIEINHFTGGLNVTNNVGNVKIDGVVAGDWEVKTDLGNIEVLIPEDGSYRYHFKTDIGDVNVNNPPFLNDSSGEVNGGEYNLNLTVDLGNIEVMTK